MDDDDLDCDERQWEARSGEFVYDFDAPRATAIALLGLELVAVSLCAWRSWLWAGWKEIGPDAFPGSPDAAYLYRSCRQSALYSEWLLLGVWICAVILLLSTPKLELSRLKRSKTSLRIVLVVLPAIVWVWICLAGAAV